MRPQTVETPGLDTILSPSGATEHIPMEFEISKELMSKEQKCKNGWNDVNIAIILYCMVDKTPLVWHNYPTDVLFHCPKCGRKWKKEKSWLEESLPQSINETTTTG